MCDSKRMRRYVHHRSDIVYHEDYIRKKKLKIFLFFNTKYIVTSMDRVME